MKRHLILALIVAASAAFLAGCARNQSQQPASLPSFVAPAAALPVGLPITVQVSPPGRYLGASETQQFAATVSNTDNTAVTWTLSCSAQECGTISGNGLYTAPNFVSAAVWVTVTAKSAADSSRSGSVYLRLMPVSISITPAFAGNLPPGSTQSFTAAVQYDPQHAGVIWALSGPGCSAEGCGTLSNVTSTAAVYRAPDTEPNPDVATVTATSITDPNQKGSVTFTVHAQPPTVLEGDYAFLINGYSNSLEAMAGHLAFHSDGTVSGVLDANRGPNADVAQPITGNYSIQPNGHGTLTLQTVSAVWTYVVTLDLSGASGRLAEAVGPSAYSSSSGYMVRQDATCFNLPSLGGDRVIALYGEATGSHVAALGRFTLDGTGSLNNAAMDLSWAINENAAQFPNSVALTGAFAAPDASTGRGTASLNVSGNGSSTYHFAYYIVSNERLLLIQTDARGFLSGLLIPMLSGEVRRQHNAGAFTNASFNSPAVFHLTDSTDDWIGDGFPMIRVGQMAPNGLGVLSITFDQNVGGRFYATIGGYGSGKITLNGTTNGTYSVSANGRATWSHPALSLPVGSEAALAYLTDQNKGYFMVQDLDGAAFGAFEPQTTAPFSITAGTYRLNTGPPATYSVENDGGWMTLGADGSGTAMLYVNAGSGATLYVLTATATMAANGRGMLVLNAPAPFGTRNLVFWAVTPTTWVAVSTVNDGDRQPVLLFVERTE